MSNPKKVLIVKTGYSEVMDRGVSTTVSLGDVLICTCILYPYENDHVTWVTSWAAKKLLEGNPYIQRLLIFDSNTLKEITSGTYDILINLEKEIGICTLLNGVKAERRFGFYFDETIHNIATYKKSTEYLLSGQENHKHHKRNSLQVLFDTIGKKWDGEGFIYQKDRLAKKERYDIGFNYYVGSKWPTKAWPQEQWKKLEAILKPRYKVSWQKGHKNLQRYIDWINSCKVIVTSDSLGQALGQALGKQVVTVYGSTNFRRMQNIPNIHIIHSPLKCPYMPCYMPVCRFDKFCMDHIEPSKVAEMCEKILAKHKKAITART